MIGDRIRWLRTRRKMSQADLAEVLGMSDQQVHRWENSHSKPDIEALGKLAKVFDVTSDYLIGLSDDPRGNRAVELSERELAIIQALRESDLTSFMMLLADDLKARE